MIKSNSLKEQELIGVQLKVEWHLDFFSSQLCETPWVSRFRARVTFNNGGVPMLGHSEQSVKSG